jgi:tRNA 5-methylaminomethyl-2-thiouridine biosynthesis bifunctional protein
MAGEIDQALVDWRASAPRSIFFDDIYFSDDGPAESRRVFLDGTGLPDRFRTAPRLTVGELGFGTGLNILVAWDAWRRAEKPAGARLQFLSFEKFPLTRDDLARAHQAWPQLAALSAPMIAAYPPPLAGLHRIALADDVSLALAFGDARAMAANLEASVDAWFLDGFAPAKNPDMWTPALFAEVARLSAPGATAATFTVARAAKDALSGAGFALSKRPGYGRKREMLTARLDAPRRESRRAPWFANDRLQPPPPAAEIAVIGGGIAGAGLADALRRAGLAPTIIDPFGVAAGASGNPAGLIMPRLDLGGGAAGRFFLNAYAHAVLTIDSLERAFGERCFLPCGALLRPLNEEDRRRQARIAAAGLLPDGWIEAQSDGLFFPQAGVVDPRRYCRLLAGDAPIVRKRARALQSSDRVEVLFDDGESRRFDAAILANGCAALRFHEARTLPLSAVAGQIDLFPLARAPDCAIAFGPYAAPAPGGGLVIGATYRPAASDAPPPSADATEENIAAIRAALPDIGAPLAAGAAQPRAAIRCQTPDRLPVAGPLPDWHHCAAVYDDLRFGRSRDYPPARVAPGIFILAGLGSRGLVTAPLAAAMIAAEMVGAPVERDIAEALHPARFFIRTLKRAGDPGAALMAAVAPE